MENKIIKGNSIDLSELSKYNGKSEFENAKTIIEILAAKSKFYDIDQTVRIVSPNK